MQNKVFKIKAIFFKHFFITIKRKIEDNLKEKLDLRGIKWVNSQKQFMFISSTFVKLKKKIQN